MEPITTAIVSALAAGATAAAKGVATGAVKDAYTALKRVIADRYMKVGPFVEAMTTNPSSVAEQQTLAKELERTQAVNDDVLKKHVISLLDSIQTLRLDPKSSALFDFDGLLRARNLELEDISSIGPVLRVGGDAVFEGDFKARGVRQISGVDPEKY